MAVIQTKDLRNICFLGHGGSGKTSLAEAMLYMNKATDRLGSTGAGNTVCDYDPEEIKRGFTISASCANFNYKNVKINLIDTPGFLEFVGEVLTGLRVAGSAVITVDAKSGIQVGTELAWENTSAAGSPRAFFVNKCDDPEANFQKVLASLIEAFGQSVCPIVVPAATPGAFINLLDLKKYVYDAKGGHTVGEINADYMPTVEKYREQLFEAIATTDEALMEKYFNGEEITKEEANEAVHKGVSDGSIVPVFSGAATKLWGVDTLVEIIADAFPNPISKGSERVIVDGKEEKKAIRTEGAPELFVFKTTVDQFGRTTYFKVMAGELTSGVTLKNNRSGAAEKMAHFSTVVGKKTTEVQALSCGDIGVITKLVGTGTGDTLSESGEVEYAGVKYPEPFYTMAVAPKNKGEEDKIAQGINRLLDEDKTLRFENDAETKQLLLSAMGNMQIDVALSKLKSRNGLDVVLSAPRIAYRETIKGRSDVQGKHKKQSGGHGQYGDVKIRFSPGEGDGLTFTQSVVGGSVPKNYFPAIEKGLLEAMQKGVLAGYPVVGLAADLYDGSYHDVDSNELSFKMAASLAYKAGLPLAKPVLLEPIGELKVTIPDSVVGAVMGDINSKRRGTVLGSNPAEGKPGYTTIDAEVPKATMVEYTIDLRAMTQGKGSYSFYFVRYDEVPGSEAQKIIAEAKANMSEED